jgi:predicted nucleotidyltransferase
MHPLIAVNLDAIQEIGREFGVERLEVFGSICTPDFDENQSDIDFLVEFPPNYDFGPWHAKYHALQRALSAQLEHPVDLVDVRALRDPWLLREAGKTRQVVYDATNIRQTA